MNKKLFTKKQVMHIRNLLKNSENVRPIFTYLHIDQDGYLEFTDSYQFHRSKDPLFDSGNDRFVSLNDLIIWYKLASTKDMLDTDHLKTIMFENDDLKYFDTTRIRVNDSNITAIEKIAFDDKKMITFINILGDTKTQLKFTGEYQAMYSSNELFDGLLLPMKLY